MAERPTERVKRKFSRTFRRANTCQQSEMIPRMMINLEQPLSSHDQQAATTIDINVKRAIKQQSAKKRRQRLAVLAFPVEKEEKINQVELSCFEIRKRSKRFYFAK